MRLSKTVPLPALSSPEEKHTHDRFVVGIHESIIEYSLTRTMHTRGIALSLTYRGTCTVVGNHRLTRGIMLTSPQIGSVMGYCGQTLVTQATLDALTTLLLSKTLVYEDQLQLAVSSYTSGTGM